MARSDSRRGVPLGAYNSSVEAARCEDGVQVVPWGQAEVREVPPATGTPEGHWIFREHRELSSPQPFTLEVAGGTVVGDFGAVVTPGRMLDFETSPYFRVAEWREHPLFLKGRLPEVTPVDGTLVSLAVRGGSSNYYHFLFDALPRWEIFRRTHPGVVPDAVLVPHSTRYQKALLEMLELDVPFIQPTSTTAYRADRLLVPSTPNEHLTAPTWVVEWLRATFPPKATGGPKRLYLTRGRAPMTRRVVREPELLEALEQRGFVCVDPGEFTVQEQIDLFAGAEFVLSPHGAALTNIVHCREAVTVVEMFPNSYVHTGLWNITHSLPNISYRYLVENGSHKEGRPMLSIADDIQLSPSDVLAVVDRYLT